MKEGGATDSSPPSASEIRIPPLPEGWHVVRHAILADGALAIVGADVDILAEWRRDTSGTLGLPDKAAAQAHARVWTFDGAALAAGPGFPLQTPYPLVDRFPDGRWLVASVRAHDERNARTLSPSGEELNRIRLGDGIERLKIDTAGRIWVGWFDEGVFGNEDWRTPGLEWPPSAAGVGAFDDQGRFFPAHDAARPPPIAECYALNLVGEEAYACTYMDFPILRMAVGEAERCWPSELDGPRALAVRPPFVLAAGGYGEDSDRVVLVRLGTHQAFTVGEWRLPFRLRRPEDVDFFDGRGEVISAVRQGVWHRWRIDDFIAQASARRSG